MALDDAPSKQHTNVQQRGLLSGLSRPRQLHLQRQRVATFAAFVGFGLASWIMTNVTYVELGVFLRELPEHYSIYAYSILALETANLYPLLYMLFNARQQLLSQSTVIWWILLQGLCGHAAPHPLRGMVSTTSSVVFYPMVASFPPLFTSALATGEGLSGSVAALLCIVQDPGGELRFSVSTFYLLCASIMCTSLVAFAFLQYHPWALAAKTLDEVSVVANGLIHNQKPQDCDIDVREAEEDTLLTRSPCGSCPSSTSASTATIESPNASQRSELTSSAAVFRQVWQLLACQWILAAFSFGWLPSTMPYVYKKYALTDDAETETARFQTTASIAALILSPLASVSTT
ncbi:Endogenous retrovirus receptor [Phytophthora cactorum]|nr:Endogenous retrovirus receptor [Phytophthora cactorum]